MNNEKITRSHRITVRFSDEEIKILDNLRKDKIISEYIREILLGSEYVKKNYHKCGDGYNAIHRYNLRKHGKANRCENFNCKRKYKRYHWALKRGKKYSKNINDYYQLCPMCHRQYDIGKIDIIVKT